MLNPSYLIKSRHDIYYFRYPLPLGQLGKSNRVSISLKTRCPRQALRFARMLEYHSVNLITRMDFSRMDHTDIMSLFKSYYTELLERSKARIDKDGPLSKPHAQNITKHLKNLDALIEDDSDDELELLGIDTDNPMDSLVHKDLQPIMNKYELDFDPDSREFGMMKAAYKHACRNYFNDILTYNNQAMDYSLLETTSEKTFRTVSHNKPEYRLGSIIQSYLKETEPTITARSFKDQTDCLNYLTDFYGTDCPIVKIDAVQALHMKEQLLVTPTGRNKGKLTKEKPLLEQISIAEQHKLDRLSATSVNKYLGYFSSLFDWAKRHRLAEENFFDGLRIKNNKKANRREMFKKEEVALILKELQINSSGKVKNKSQYWGTLIAIYTGARRNEIAALLVNDVRQDQETSIWYFNIADEEEEGKDLKTEAARRIVPIHPKLIELGFIDYWQEAKQKVKSLPKRGGMEARLLYDFTYTEHDKWGRKLGQFVNDRLLKHLGIHVKNKKTLHSLRHSFITYLDVANVKATTIKSMVGHEQGTVTHGIYTHYGVEHLPQFKEAIEKLPY